ncbi:type IV pilus modification protein PilV [Acinetobacter sp. NIPH 1852]|uniref:type IV pilus modification protein PilV n=1 Tax=unclassified Acinetobacter TaxID=196816 RepID=UPI0002D0CEA7|nr:MULTISPECIES: type IV pilus modification protein PilV [unclassified Acinetobacter]ENU29001.1 type IV pilus modification protein PilV [Acinetobacter sp. CIP-A165]MCH7309530.1 type IV pilus modification protein PilV [Acinetobacter sp. NIPH 1852]
MNINKHQQGVGLVEVLVALLLLAVGVLGYTILQLRAVDASSEALARSQGMLILRGLAENMRANPDAQTNYPAAVRAYTNITATPTSPSNACFNPASACTPTQMATYDAFMAARTAFEIGMNITMDTCPGVIAAPVQRQCLFAAWGDTELSATNTAADVSECMGATGVYVNRSSCLMMEVY